MPTARTPAGRVFCAAVADELIARGAAMGMSMTATGRFLGYAGNGAQLCAIHRGSTHMSIDALVYFASRLNTTVSDIIAGAEGRISETESRLAAEAEVREFRAKRLRDV